MQRIAAQLEKLVGKGKMKPEEKSSVGLWIAITRRELDWWVCSVNKCKCAARMLCRLVARSMAPTGPSVGIP